MGFKLLDFLFASATVDAAKRAMGSDGKLHQKLEAAEERTKQEQRAQNLSTYEQLHEYCVHFHDAEFDNYRVGTDYNLTGEYIYAHDLFRDLAKRFPNNDNNPNAFPIDTEAMGKALMIKWGPYLRENQLTYGTVDKQSSYYDVSEYCFGEGRRWAAINGFAPSNVLHKIWRGWSPYSYWTLLPARYGIPASKCDEIMQRGSWFLGKNTLQFTGREYLEHVDLCKKLDERIVYLREHPSICPYETVDGALWVSWWFRELGYDTPLVSSDHHPMYLAAWKKFCDDRGIYRYNINGASDNVRRAIMEIRDKKNLEGRTVI